jgi:protein SSD1
MTIANLLFSYIALPPYNRKMVQKISFECNSKKDGAKNAQDVNIELYLSKYLNTVEQRDGPIYKKADVIVVGKDTYDVYVPEYGIEKRMYLRDLPIEQYYFDKNTLALDIFWKRGVPVTMHNEEKMYAQERVRKDDYGDDSEDELDQVTDSLTALAMKELEVLEDTVNADDLVHPVILEENTCMQRIQMFSVIDVRIQVNMERSPPIINVYPVNPFSGEKEEGSA